MNPKILIVDDEQEIADLVTKWLVKQKYDVRACYSGYQALEIFEQTAADILVTDIRMPGMDGMELIEEVKKKWPDTVIIIVTAHGNLDLAARAMKQGATDMLTKPVDPERLRLSLEGACAKLRMNWELQRAIDKLRDSEERNRLFLESVSEGIYGLNQEGETTFINPAASRMLGYEPEEIIGRNSHFLIHHTKDDGTPYLKEECRMQKAMRDRQPVPPTRETLWRKDGSGIPVEYTSTPVFRKGKVHGAVVVFRDISERLRMEEERKTMQENLLQTQKFQSLYAMAGGIAHNFNNILTAVIGNLELTMTCLPEDPKCMQTCKAAMRAAERAAELSTLMLTYVGQGKANMEVVDLACLLRDSFELLNSIASGRSAVVIEPPGQPVYFKGDKAMLRQILVNLVTNGVEAYGEEGGKVTIRWYTKHFNQAMLQRPYHESELVEGTYFCLEVSDQGCGMERQEIRRAFEPFYSTKFTGRGLGLAVVLGIMRIHKGALELVSTPGSGATARLLFPEVVDKPAAREAVAPEKKLPLSKGTALLVDDEEVVLITGAGMMRFLGFEVLTTTDSSQALGIYKENRDDISLLVLDLAMPGLDGREILARIRATGDKVPAIIATGYSVQQVRERFLGLEPVAFVQKPFTMELLRKRIRDVCW